VSNEDGEDVEDSFSDGDGEGGGRVALEELGDGEEDVGR